MDRREFLQLLSGVGLCAVGPMAVNRAFAQSAPPDRHFVFVNAGGGWDPTSLCDPKGEAERSDGRGPVNHFRAEDIGTVAGSEIRYAPFPDEELATSTLRTDSALSSFAPFFEDVADDLLVINGIDAQTNSHTIGSRTIWSGSAKLGQPSFAALVARAYSPDSPLSFITNGGYDVSASLVAPTRLSGSGVFRELAYPERYNTNDNADLSNPSTYYLPPEIGSLIDQTRAARRQRMAASEGLPQRRAAMSRLFTVASGDNSLDRLVDALPSSVSGGLRGQAEIAIAAFQAQVAVSANLSTGGFDTHGDHDRNQTHSLANLVDGVHHLWTLIRNAGLQDRVTVLVGSDFGRTPFYNGGDGKDHWNVTSMLALGAGVSGNRVVGATDANYRALKLDPGSLQVAADQNSPSAVTLTASHVHRALRGLAGISGSAAAQEFALDPSEDLALFS